MTKLPDRRCLAAAGFAFAAIVLGGGGSSAPLSETLLELAACLAAAVWATSPPSPAMSAPQDRAVAALAAIAVLLPLAQLAPLPPPVWQALPGRDIERMALEAAGSAAVWMPWSMAPGRTLASLLSLGPPLLAMAMTARLDLAGRRLVLRAIALAVLASLLLGALQLASGESGWWRPYGNENLGFLNGFQANRNAEADVLLIGLVAAAAALGDGGAGGRSGGGLEGLLLAGLVILLLLGCVLTGSRTGAALIPVALAAVALIWRPERLRLRHAGRALAVLAAAIGGIWLLVRHNARIGLVAARFAPERDFRLELWRDTRFAIAQYWPFGSGMGSFKAVFPGSERLEVVDPTEPVRAHNDFLELALEGGAFGIGLLALAAAICGWMAWRAWRTRLPASYPQFICAIAVALTIGLHSVVDYPLRSMALACMIGIAAGLLVPAKEQT